MLGLALRSLLQHRTSAAATGIVAVVGTVLLSAMAALLGTGLADETASSDREFLLPFPIILGGWILAIVVFAMISTIGVSLQGRTGEIAELRLIGATPGQIREMTAVETTVICVAAAIPGVLGGYLLGWMLMNGVRTAGLITRATEFSPGLITPLVATLPVILAGVVAALLGSRTLAARSPVADDIPQGRSRSSHRSELVRRFAAGIAIAAGLGSSLAVLGMDPSDVLTTAMTGPGCVLVAVGLSLLAPELVAVANSVGRRLPWTRSRGSTWLSTTNLAVAPKRARPVVTFLTLFAGVTAGTLSMQGIENSVASPTSEGTVIASINYLVVILIAAFMAIALTNNLIASIARRRPEFVTMSLIGSTSGQTRATLVQETMLGVVISVVAGCAGAVLSTIPFAIVKTGGPLAAFEPFPYAITALVGAALAIGVTLIAGRRAVRSR